MDKKIAIATWYKNGNLGGTLQAYALQRVINTFGYNSEFVDYFPDKTSIRYRATRLLKDIYVLSFHPKVHRTRQKIYQFVRQDLHCSRPYYIYADLVKAADSNYFAAICGSDQIWAHALGTIDEVYYLTFINKEKRIAYAPSTGYNRISNQLKERFSELVNEIRFLSVRERQGAEFVYKITGCKAKVVLDPSLLLSKEQWLEEIKSRVPEKSRQTGYILAYFLGGNKLHTQRIYAVAEKIGLPVLSIAYRNSVFDKSGQVVVGPLEFLELINNAEYIFTDSFHGVALSINFEKEFVAFKRFKDDDPINQNSRIINILEKTGLPDRLIEDDAPLEDLIAKPIDYSVVRGLLESERKKSLSYLHDAINTIALENE